MAGLVKRDKGQSTVKADTLKLAGLSILACVALSLPLISPSACQGADFTRAKKIFVPPSRIPRRFDAESVRESGAGSDPGYDPAFGQPEETSSIPSSPSSGHVAKASKYGLIPPPPPLTPSILPPALLRSQGAQEEGFSSAAGSAHASRWSTNVSDTLSRAAKSTKVKSLVDQAQDRVDRMVANGDLTQAQQAVLRYLKAYPKDPKMQAKFAQVTVAKAKELMNSQNLAAAAEAARNALTVQPGSKSAASVLSEILSKQGVKSDSAEERIKLAQSLAAQGKANEAAVEYQQSLAVKPTAEAHVGLGDLALKCGHKDKAKLEYQKALEQKPDSALALRQLGTLRLSQGDVVGANSDLSRALILNPHDKQASSNLVGLWQGQISRNPSSANGHLGLARAFQLSGDLRSAQSEYRQVVKLDPQNPHLPAARQSFKLALARQQSAQSVAAAHTLESQGAVQAAYDKVLEAKRLTPADSSVGLYEGQLAEKLGLTAQAHDAYLNVLKSDPNNVSAAHALAHLPTVAATAATAAAGAAIASAASSRGSTATPNSVSLLPSTSAPSSASPYAGLAGNPAAMAALRQPIAELPPARTIPLPAQAGGSPASAAFAQPASAGPGVGAAAQHASSTAHVANLSTFMGSLRDAAVKNQIAMQEWESQVHKHLTGRSSYYEANGTLGDVPITPEAIVGAPQNKGSDSFVSRALADLGFGQTVPTNGKESAEGAPSGLPAELRSGLPESGASSSSADTAAGALSSQNKVSNFLAGLGLGSDSAAEGTASTASAASSGSAGEAAAHSLAAKPASIRSALKNSFSQMRDQVKSDAYQGLGLAPATSSESASGAAAQEGSAAGAAATEGSEAPKTMSGILKNNVSQALESKVYSKLGLPLPQTAPAATATAAAAPPVAPAISSVQSAGAASAAAAVPADYAALKAQNQQLQNQLMQVQQQMNSMKGSMPTAGASLPESAATTPLTGMSALPQASANALPAALSALPPAQNAAQAVSNVANHLRPPIPPGAAVKFELEGVKPSQNGLNLKVVLRNQQGVPLSLPSHTKAVIRTSGAKDQEVKVSFPGRSVPPGGELHGLVRIPGRRLNPTSDLYLPALLGQGSDGDVHLTVPISSL